MCSVKIELQIVQKNIFSLKEKLYFLSITKINEWLGITEISVLFGTHDNLYLGFGGAIVWMLVGSSINMM